MNVTITEVIFSTLILLIMYLLALEYKSWFSAVVGVGIGLAEVARIVAQGANADVIIQWGFNASTNSFFSQSIDGYMIVIIMALLTAFGLVIIEGIGKKRVD